jgi:Cu+-exporting ATPase
MLSATFGILGPVAAAILHQIGSLLVLLNSMRLLVFGDWWELPPLRQLRGLGISISRLDEKIDLEQARNRIWHHRRGAAACVIAVLMLFYFTSGWTSIGPDQAGLLQRFGRFRETLGPGLHLRWPYPLEHVTTMARDRIRSLVLGFQGPGARGNEPLRWESDHGRRSEADDDDDAPPLLLTGDGRYVEMAATLQFSIDPGDPQALRRFVFDVADGEAALRPLAESVVREVVARRPLLELLSTHRREAETAAAELLASRVAAYRMGVAVRDISFQDIHPPLDVVDAYRDVSRAVSDRQRRINEANAYRDQVVAAATGQSRKLLDAAQAGRSSRLALAASEADCFNSLYSARSDAPSLTDFTLFWAKVAPAFAGKTKMILDDEPGRRRNLIVPGISLEQAVPVIGDDRGKIIHASPSEVPPVETISRPFLAEKPKP